MTTSTTGTTAFDPALGDFVVSAFAKCGIRRTGLTSEMLQDARFETNLIMANWSARGVNMWAVDLISIPLLAGVYKYSIPNDTVFLLDVYLTTVAAPVTDRLIFPISRSDYASIANKTNEATPTSYWFDKLISPSVYLWPVPNLDDNWTLSIWRATRLQDAALSNGTGPELVYKFYDAFVWELAARMALIYAPERAPALATAAKMSWEDSIAADTQDVGIKFMLGMSGYYR